jgi:hypothetical protein
LLATLTEADFSNGSENIFALICVVMVSSFTLLHETARNNDAAKTAGNQRRRTMKPPRVGTRHHGAGLRDKGFGANPLGKRKLRHAEFPG